MNATSASERLERPKARETMVRRVKELFGRLRPERPVLYGVLQSAWGFSTGPVTFLLIALRFSPEIQGYYFTFFSLLALQATAEFGFGQVIVQFASHEWAALTLTRDGSIAGDRNALSRLISIGRFAMAWYLTVSIAIGVSLAVGGYWFLAMSPQHGISWQRPWLAICLLSAMLMFSLSFWSVLEGCNQVSEIYRFRLIESIVYVLSLWTGIALGAGLWSPVISSAVKLAWHLTFLSGRRYRRFFRPFFGEPQSARVSWRFEIWKLQWRFALTWLGGYFCYSAFTPIAFHLRGPAVAGQVGMTLTLGRVVVSVAALLVMVKGPTFGTLVARRRYRELDRLMAGANAASLAVALAGAGSIWLVVYLLYASRSRFMLRVLPPLPAATFLAAAVFMQAIANQSVYLRAHKREPFMKIYVAAAPVILVASWFLCGRFGPTGMGIGYAAIAGLMLPACTVIFQRCRAAWHIGEELEGSTTFKRPAAAQ